MSPRQDLWQILADVINVNLRAGILRSLHLLPLPLDLIWHYYYFFFVGSAALSAAFNK